MKLLLLKDELDAFITSVKKSVFERYVKFTVEPHSHNPAKEAHNHLFWVVFEVDQNDMSILLSEIWRAGVYYSQIKFKAL